MTKNIKGNVSANISVNTLNFLSLGATHLETSTATITSTLDARGASNLTVRENFTIDDISTNDISCINFDASFARTSMLVCADMSRADVSCGVMNFGTGSGTDLFSTAMSTANLTTTNATCTEISSNVFSINTNSGAINFNDKASISFADDFLVSGKLDISTEIRARPNQGDEGLLLRCHDADTGTVQSQLDLLQNGEIYSMELLALT